ncbi:phosphotransferase [Vibrio nomapromontoriensis]|uniref:phosphotransferase n=1 Tax=Vibrio nomapromontoriensis TaxID=2910246 RepID=UPI003D0FCE36
MLDWQQALQQQPELAHAQTVLNEVPLGALQLSGGLTNRTWKIATKTHGWTVWRGHTKISAAFDICRVNERNVLQAVQTLLPTSQVLGDNAHGVLLSWLEGRPISCAELSAEKVISLLAHIHTFSGDSIDGDSIGIRRFDYTEKVDHYWHQLNPSIYKSRYQELYVKLRIPPALHCNHSALCHFDFAHHNLIRSHQSIAVIDWEYSAIADPRLDLVLTLDMLDMDYPQGLNCYLQAYGLSDPNAVIDREQWLSDMNAWSAHAQMMALLWYVLAAQLWDNDDFLIDAESIYQRLCRSDHCL